MHRDSNILIVEDDNIVALDIKNKLKKIGYENSKILLNADNLFSYAETVNPELVLMDIRLPGAIDGIKAAEILWHEYDTPVVYVTAYSDPQTLRRAKNTFPLAYILKPFDERKLQVAINIAFTNNMYRNHLKSKISELKEAQTSPKFSGHTVPLCIKCKMVRGSNGTWQESDNYFTEEMGIVFKRGLCPECAQKEYPSNCDENKF